MKEKQRTCIKCGLSKPLKEFSLSWWMQSGYLVKCKSCEKEDQRKWEEHTFPAPPPLLVLELKLLDKNKEE